MDLFKERMIGPLTTGGLMVATMCKFGEFTPKNFAVTILEAKAHYKGWLRKNNLTQEEYEKRLVDSEQYVRYNQGMSKFLLVDASHMFHRAKHSVRGDQSEKIGMCLHIIFNSLSKAWRKHGADHIVFAFDGRSWRKDIYKPYKANRPVASNPTELADAKLFFEAFDIFREFIRTKTNCTVLEHPTLEADDLISGFIQAHPDDSHVIVSSDGDFEQLLTSKVVLYNGVDDVTIGLNGIFDYKGNPVLDKKTGNPKTPPNPEWSVFEKSVRGCTTDNIFSAYPGIREKGSKNKIGLRQAFEDRVKRGFDWNSVMMHHWTDHHGVEHKVMDDYLRNKQLVDLKDQPNDIQVVIFETVGAASSPRNTPQIGLHFLKFCGKYDLQKVSEQANTYSQMLNAQYPNA